MKKIFIMLLMCCPLMCAAQSEWEAPTSHKQNSEANVDKKDVKKDAKTPNTTIDPKDIKDWEYIKPGVVPEVDGKVVFDYELDLPGMTAQQIYDKTYVALDSLANTENQINSCVALVNRKEHMIAARYQEWLEFTRNFLSLDRTKFSYTIVASCTDNHLSIKLQRISYNYEEERQNGFKTTAEKWISDKYAVNKKRTRLISGPAKFRRKTIDRKNDIFKYITEKVKQ